jgi:hypothetical protein
VKNHCTAKLSCSTLQPSERRIGLCGDATRAPTQLPKWHGAVASAAAPMFSPLPFWRQRGKSQGSGDRVPSASLSHNLCAHAGTASNSAGVR